MQPRRRYRATCGVLRRSAAGTGRSVARLAGGRCCRDCTARVTRSWPETRPVARTLPSRAAGGRAHEVAAHESEAEMEADGRCQGGVLAVASIS